MRDITKKFALLFTAMLLLVFVFSGCKGNMNKDDGESDTKAESNVQAQTPTKGLAYTLNDDGTAYVVTGIGTASDSDIIIPSTYEGLPVTSIGERAFYFCEHITSMTLPDSIIHIEDRAFNGCSAMTSFRMSNRVTSIGEGAFTACVSLTNFTIPSGVTQIGRNAFLACYKLVEMWNYSSVTLTQGEVLHRDTVFAVHTSPNEVSKLHTTDDGYVFYVDGETVYLVAYHGKDTNLTLPEGYNGKAYEINKYAFYQCKNRSIVIPNGVTGIGEYAFGYSDALMSIKISEDVSSIHRDAFYGCSRLIEVWNCSPISIAVGNTSNEEPVIENALVIHTSAGAASRLHETDDGYVFYADDERVYLAAYLGNAAELSLPEKYNGRSYDIYKYAFLECDNLKSVVIPNGITSIGNGAFYGCNYLTSISIPNSVEVIGASLFMGCRNLTIYCEAESQPSGWSANWNDGDFPVFWG